MADPTTIATAITVGQATGVLLLGGLMGLFGQGIRVVVGLKGMVDDANQKRVSQSSLFDAAKLVISLVIGFLTGLGATLALGLDKFLNLHTDNLQPLLGIAAAGYAGTDFIEGFISQYLPGGKAAGAVKAADRPGAGDAGTAGSDGSAPQPPAGGSRKDDALHAKVDGVASELSAVSEAVGGVRSQLGDVTNIADGESLPVLHDKMDALAMQVDDLRHNLVAAGVAPAQTDITGRVSAFIVQKMFPATRLSNIVKNLPTVFEGLRFKDLTDKAMVNMALSTIRAETESFEPIPEGKSRFNTANTPFDKYEPNTKVGKSLGNTEPGDGPRFKGRGYVQLTGRHNYTRIGGQLDVNLVANPDLACDPAIAGKILAQFLSNAEQDIRDALAAGDLVKARKLVNGGTNGFERFKSAFEIGVNVLPA